MRRIMHKSLINPNGNWIAAANHLIGDEKALAHAIIISVRGSAPRELGANMLISENQIWNTIGGGSLEFEVMEQARGLIKEIGLKVEGSNRKVLNLALFKFSPSNTSFCLITRQDNGHNPLKY